MPVGEWIANVRHEAKRELLRASRPEFKRRQRLSGVAFRQPQQFQRVVRRLERDDRGFAFGRHWQKLEARCSYDAECTLRTDQQIAQIVPGVVLFQPPQPMPDAAVGKHGFEPKRQIPRIAVGEDGRAPGVCRKHAADLALPSDARLRGNNRPVFFAAFWASSSVTPASTIIVPPGRIDVANSLAAARATARFRCRRATEFVRRQGRYCHLAERCRRLRYGKRKNTRDFIRRAGPQHHRRLARIAVTPFAKISALDPRRASTHSLRRRSQRNVRSNLRECSSSARDLPTAS